MAPWILAVENMEDCDVLSYHLHVAPRMIFMLRLTQINAALWLYYVGAIVMYIWRDIASNVLLRAMVGVNGCINYCL